MVVVFVYEVDQAQVAAFERVYATDGEWAAFFRQDPSYLGSEMRRSADRSLRYLVLDRWESHESYAAFLDRYQEDYKRRSAATETLYRREVRVGEFA